MDIGSLTGQVALEDQLSEGLSLIAEHVKQFAEGFDSAIGGLAIGVGVLGAAIAGAIISVEKLGEEGSKIQGVTNAFDTLAAKAGTTGDALRGSLTEGLRGTISEMQLMQDTSKLLGSGMKLTTDQTLVMGQAARELGKATGGDASSGLEMMSTALTTGRVRGLQQQIGLIDLAAGEQKFAESIGVTVGQLNEAGKLEGKRIAILDATQAYLDRVGVSELSFAEKVKQGWVAIEEWGAALSKAVSSSADVNAALDAIKQAITDAFGGDGKTLMDAIVGAINEFARGVTAAIPYVVKFGEGIQTVWNFLADNEGTILGATEIVGAFGAAWLVWTIGGALVTGIVSGFAAVATGVAGLTTVIALNPLGAMAIAAAAAGTGISLYAQHQAAAALAAQVAGAQQDVMNKAIIAGDTALKGMAPSATNAAKAAEYLANVGKVAGDVTNGLNEELDHSNDKYLKVVDAAAKAAAATKKYNDAVNSIVDGLVGESTKTLETVDALNEAIATNDLDAESIQRIADKIDELHKKHLIQIGDLTAWADANRVLKGTIDALHGPLTELSLPIADNTAHVDEMATSSCSQ